MERFLRLSVVIVAMLIWTVTMSAADSEPYCITLIEVNQDSDSKDVGDGRHGHRMPPRPIDCSISKKGGIQIYSTDTFDIVAYEVYTIDGVPVASFTEEDSFVDYLYSSVGNMEIRFVTNESLLIGYISL